MKAQNARLFLASLALSLLAGSAHAAAMKGEAPACRDEETLRKGLQSLAGKSEKATGDVAKSRQSFFETLYASGECAKLEAGQIVVIDIRHGGLWCVRQAGGLDCLWTLAQAISLTPPKPGAQLEGPQHPKAPWSQ